jgi:hypothetical protein
MAARICPQCRTRVDERRAKTSPYCLSCGSPLGTPPPMAFGKPPAKGSALPWILGGIGIVLLLGFGAVVLVVVAVANAAPDPKPVPTEDPRGPRLEAPTATVTATAVASVKPSATVKPTATAPIVTARPQPTFTAQPIPTPTSPPVVGAFPRARATNELDRVTAGLGSCRRTGDPTGSGSIRVDFEPDGRVGTLLARPFAGTTTGSCISSRFLGIRIGEFTGTTQQIQRTFTIPRANDPGF